MLVLEYLFSNFRLSRETGVRFPPKPEDIFDLTVRNVDNFLNGIHKMFSGEMVAYFKRTPTEPRWERRARSFKYHSITGQDIGHIVLVSEANGREEMIDVDVENATRFAFLRPRGKDYLGIPAGVYISSGFQTPNLWYGRREVILVKDIHHPYQIL